MAQSIKSLSLILPALFLSTYANASLETTCVGPEENAKMNLIYLHGDSASPIDGEPYSREILSELANELNIRIALPLSRWKRTPSDLWWPNVLNSFKLKELVPEILESRLNCFSEDTPFGVIGYSNGAILIARWLSATWLDEFRRPLWGISVSGGKAANPGVTAAQTKSETFKRNITFLFGSEDEFNLDPELKTMNKYLDAGIIADQILFDGGHDFPKDEIQEILKGKMPK